MGKIILVPPPIRMEYMKPNPAAPSYMSHTTYPVMFNMPTSGENISMNASVVIPNPSTVNEYYDPMIMYTKFYNFSTREGYSGSYMIHRVHTSELKKTFWGHQEIEKIAASMHGDLLLQIEETDQSGMGSMGWNFAATDMRDAQIVSHFPSRRKDHRFDTPKLLRSEIKEWVQHNVRGEWDHFEHQWGAPKDEFYIKDDNEAIHFKMKWFGVEPEEEAA